MENLSNEIWKDVNEFENQYQISNFGRLRSKSRKINSSISRCGFRIYKAKIRSQQDNGNGYKQCSVQIKRKRYIEYTHRLVAKYFLSNPENKHEVNHIDADKSNNSVSNLEWCTLKENRLHAIKNGLINKGEKSYMSKLTDNDVLRIKRLFRINPDFNKCQIARKLNVSDSTIHDIVKNRTWKHII